MIRRRWPAAALWLGHYSAVPIWTAIAMTLIDAALNAQRGVLEWITTAGWLAAVAALYIEAGYHREALCERCIAEAPLDPQAAVAKRRHILRAYHAGRRGVVAAIAVLACDAPLLFVNHRQPPAWANALVAFGCLVFGMSITASWQHRRLYPWCPFCRWGEGGAEEAVPDVPAPAASR